MSSSLPAHRFLVLSKILAAASTFLAAVTLTSGQVDQAINQSVWKQKFGVLDAQMNEQPPYPGWLSQDADGDGVINRNEFIAGTNPFRKSSGDAHFRPPVVSANSTTLSLSFPTVPGKLYGAQSNMNLVDTWSKGSLPSVVGDGTSKTLIVPKSAGNFFHVTVTDQATQGDQVSDWAKHVLGLSPAAPITSQTSFDSNSLAANLESQNVVSLTSVDSSGSQPADASTPAGDLGLIRVTRSGFMLLGSVTIPISKSGTAVEGTDIASLPASLTFPVGVNSLDVKITPLFNANRTSPATVFITIANPGSAGAGGNYTLGTPASAGVTIYPSGNPTGTGLTATYHPGYSSTYSSPLNFGELVGATYSYTRTTTTAGTATITYSNSGTPAVPYVSGASTALQFTSGNLNIAPFNVLQSYTIATTPTTTSFIVNITGTNLPNSSSGNISIGGFTSSITRLDPKVDFNWGYGTPNGNAYINADNFSVRWDGWLSPTSTGSYTFQLDADDKARVLIDTTGTGANFVQILENGWDTAATGGFKQSSPITLNGPLAAGSRYPIRVEFADTTGSAKCRFQWKLNSGSFANIPSTNVFTDNTNATAGWSTAFFNNPTFTPPAARTQTESAVTNVNNGDWLTGSPDPSIFHNNFTARWTGQVLPQYSQKYYFVIKADDGLKLWVNNQLILDRWSFISSEATGSIDLQADVLYDIKMEYYEATGGCEARLYWYSDDQAKQIIPTHRLFPTQASPPAITSPTEAVAILGSGTPFSLNITSSNGGTISASGLPLWLSLVNGVLIGTPTKAGIYQFTLTTTNTSGTSSSVMTLEVLGTPSQLTRETWTSGVSGTSLVAVPWTNPPSTTGTVSNAESSESDGGANTGERLRGYFIAPATGNYYFWISASNAAELWISNDAEPVNKVLRASVSSVSVVAAKTWNAQANQKSSWLSLVAGRKYYIEALHNTGASGAGNHLSLAWFLDPTGNTANPITNGCLPAAASPGGIIPGYVLAPWDNPPTTAVPGTLFVTNLQGADGLSGITGTGGAFLRVNGTSAILQLNYSGLTSGATARTVQNSSGAVLFDINAQDKNYPDLKSSDGGYTWNLSPSDLTDLQSGKVHIRISTVNHPAGELTGTFGITAGSQTPPPAPSYPSWSDQHATSDAANSRFLTQATFGPSPADMSYVKTNGYHAWIENQFTLSPTKSVPYILANLSSDPQNAYGSTLMFNSWWKNSVTAPDQLRQRAAFALSQILVVSDVGPLNNNGRVLADYYDTLLDYSFGNFRDILKQVTLSPAMGVYLDMRGNSAGNIVTGQIPNENYAREILQLFSAGLYRIWPDGSLVLSSSGHAVPTYDQSVITGYARVFTGWNWGQAMTGGRLPTSFSPSPNYLDPMVLVPTRHELGTKILLDNVMLPAAIVTNQSDASTDPASNYTIQSTDPALGAGNLVTTTINNNYDLNGIKDLDAALNMIMENSAVGPYICRQLIQRLVTSDPKPEYVHRVVRAFNGEQYVAPSNASGVRGDMKEVFRAILLDYEARDPAAAADPKYGKQREPLLRVTGPARSFPAADIAGCTYRQIGLQNILITTPVPRDPPDPLAPPIPHRLVGETVRLSNFVDEGGSTSAFKVPTTQPYATSDSTPSYSLVGATGIVTINSPGYLPGDSVQIQFTSGVLNTSPYNTVRPYTVVSVTPTNFTVNIGSTAIGNTTGTSNNALLPYNFTIKNNATQTSSYSNVGNIVTLSHNQSSSGIFADTQIFIRFATGGLFGAGFDGVYTVTSASTANFTITLASSPPDSPVPPSTAQTALIPMVSGGYNVTTSGSVSTILLQHTGNHNLVAGDPVWIKFLVTNAGTPAPSGLYTVASVNGPNSFRVTTTPAISTGSQGTSGMVAYPLKLDASQWTRNGTVNLGFSTWNLGKTDNTLNQTPLNSTTVFNFYYPDYRFPGDIAKAGMTTPEFQLTNDSNTMVLTNTITQGTWNNNSGNNNGYVGFLNNGVTMDLAPYMTAAQTTNAAIPSLIDSLNALLTSGNLTSATKTHIANYVANTTNYPLSSPPSADQIRKRVRAIVHLIVTSAEYAIQR